MEAQSEVTPSHEECIARVFWAAHILFYLTKKRSHTELLQPGDHEEEEEEEEDDFDCGTSDAETTRTLLLQEPRESIRSKFLDCIAQLLSSSKGWNYVTATALRERDNCVEVDVARNDYFGVTKFNRSTSGKKECGLARAEIDYCRQLENYLSTGNQLSQLPQHIFDCMSLIKSLSSTAL